MEYHKLLYRKAIIYLSIKFHDILKSMLKISEIHNSDF